MDNTMIIILMLILFVALLAFGMYIHSVLFITGIIGLIFLEGFDFLPGLLGNEPFNRVASYTLTTIPLFVLMAQFILQSGIVKDLFYVVHKISKGQNSVLGILTLAIGGVLGAVSGSGTATSASLGQVAVPELKRHGYSDRLAGTIAAAGGSLSGIIPPSIILILYGVATETPVGSLFIGAIIPGVLLTIVFMVVMLFYLNREKAENQTSQEEIASTQEETIPVTRLIVVSVAALLIMFVIFGGIYSGLFTPTEAGAVGAFVGLLTALVLGKVNTNFIKVSVVETLKLTGMVMLIMIGAQIFARFVSLSLLPRKLIQLLEPIMDTPALVLILITALLFIMFMFIEGAAVILMSIPVLLPIIQAIEVDLLWFGVFVGVICAIGLITPPVGLSVFAVAGVTGIKSETIFSLGLIFGLVGLVVICGLMIVFPEIATFLPNSMSQ